MGFLRGLALVAVGGMILIVGSCAAIGLTTAVAVGSVADEVTEFAESDVVADWEQRAEEEQLRMHNEAINSESAVDSTFSEYDYYE